MKELLVLLHGELVGVLQQSTQGNRTFQYSVDADPVNEVSVALPYRADPYPKRKTDPFIEGLLPEGEGVRQALAQAFDISPANPFALLEHIGLECAGAVQFVRPSELDMALAETGDLIPCTERDIGRRLRSLASDPKGSWIVDKERWSLAGAQSKFALRWADGWHEAIGAEPTTHILKPGINDFRDQALNEHLSLKTLGKAGLPVAQSEYVEFDDSPAIVVERYDRLIDNGRVIRIHQEDLCQATSTLPRYKYESAKGPSALKIVRTLRESGAPETEVHRFAEGLIGNYLLGAPDAHAKNYSIILAPGLVALAPFYDIASGLPYEYLEDGIPSKKDGLRKSAMAIGGERRFGRVARKHWTKFAADSGIDEDWIVGTVRALALLIPDALDEVLREEAEAASGSLLPERLRGPIRNLCGSTLTLLDRNYP
ncbi:type II toxin-antitoxin system HipA family toxin [Zhihengliuella salsuginis]|uniref:HipA domain-containing protein n=1 Tax=Zhihengliuella salsuginis TaxID=578222 RepID=A0ABQ3GBU7_9MICC|nr:type II toxin-antitoxin system HipA family toxin [Zhihengliuella salsuginis]GHC99111.1 HipA domain-containing protein [Zhihengliuella salsuginis]